LLDVNFLKGEDKTGQRVIKLVTIGKEPWVDYAAELFLKNPCFRGFIGRTSLAKVLTGAAFIDSYSPDIVIVRINRIFGRFLSRQGFGGVPEWVDFREKVSELSSHAACFMKKIESEIVTQQRYSCQIKNNPSDLEFFYSEMYKPYIKQRFGKYAKVSSLFYLRGLLARGSLLFALKDGRPVSGLLYYVKNKEIFFARVGIDGGNPKLIKEGALQALYYFFTKMILPSFKPGDTVNLGATRPFINDGLFQYKRKWCSPGLNRDNYPYNLYFRFKNPKDAIHFLKNNPCLSYD
jgi:hypothetical protein